MITTTFRYNTAERTFCLTVKGHAGQAELGQDVICASASILAYTLAQVITTAYRHGDLESDPIVRLESGDTQIQCTCKEAVFAEIMHTYFVVQVGYMLLAHNYPEFVDFEKIEA